MIEDKIELLTTQGEQCVKRYSKRAVKATFVPFVSMPLVHSLCAAMMNDLDKIYGVSAKGERASNVAVGVLATPFMMVPVWGAVPAAAYVKTVGESYLKALADLQSRSLL